MFPLGKRPAIDFIVQEFLESGITDILVVTSRRKKIIEDFFDQSMGNSDGFYWKGKKDNNINIFFIRQKEMKGTGHAIYQAKGFIGDNPFVVAYPDDLFISKEPLSKQLIKVYKKTGKSVLSLLKVPKSEVSRYGIVDTYFKNKDENIYIKGMIEKPPIEKAPSNLMSSGRYLFTSTIFDILDDLIYTWDFTKELTQTSAISELITREGVVGHIINGKRLDIGQPLEYIKAFILYALENSDNRDRLIEYLQILNEN